MSRKDPQQLGLIIQAIPADQAPLLLADLSGAQQALAVEDAPLADQLLTDFQDRIASLVQQGVLPSSIAATIFTPTIVYWTGAGGGSSWNNPANWNDNAVPDECDDVFIRTTPGLVIEHPSGDVTIHSLHSHNPINYKGSLTLATFSEVHETFNFDGMLDELFRTLALDGGGSLSGNANAVESSAVLAFVGGRYDLNNGLVLGGEGKVQIGANNLLAQAAAAAPVVVGRPTTVAAGVVRVDAELDLFVGGTMTGPGTFVVSKTLDWIGGSMTGTGSTQIASSATAFIDTDKFDVIQDRAFLDFGSVTVSATIPTLAALIVEGSGHIENGSTGTFTVNNAVQILALSDRASFENFGFFQQDNVGPPNAPVRIGINFHNSGLVQANDGATLNFTKLLVQQVAPTQTGLVIFNATVNAANFQLLSGSVQGPGYLNIQAAPITGFNFGPGQMLWKAPSRIPSDNSIVGITLSIPSGSKLTIDAENPIVLKLSNLLNGGIVLWDTPSIRGLIILNKARIVNGGRFDAAGDGTIGALDNESYVWNSGTIFKQSVTAGNAKGETTINAFFINDGLVDVRVGSLLLMKDGQYAGTIKTHKASQTITFFLGNDDFTGAKPFEGPGKVVVSRDAFLIFEPGVTAKVQTLVLSGGKESGIKGAGTVDIADLQWTSGGLFGAGQTNVVGISIAGSAEKRINARSLTITGPGTWTGGGNILVVGTAKITLTGKKAVFKIGNGPFILKDANLGNKPSLAKLIVEKGASLIKEPGTGKTTIQIPVVNDKGFVSPAGADFVLEGGYTVVKK